eukprot:2890931-Rhodomonas_salina.1
MKHREEDRSGGMKGTGRGLREGRNDRISLLAQTWLTDLYCEKVGSLLCGDPNPGNPTLSPRFSGCG